MLEPPQSAAFDVKEAAAADIKKEAAFVIFYSKRLCRSGFEYKSIFQTESIASGVPPQQVWGMFEPVLLLKNNKKGEDF